MSVNDDKEKKKNEYYWYLHVLTNTDSSLQDTYGVGRYESMRESLLSTTCQPTRPTERMQTKRATSGTY
jgi:hypothetical protein